MIQFENETAIEIQVADLAAFEAKTGLKLPEDYKMQLLKYNGGIPEEEAYFKLGEEEYELMYFFPFRDEEDDLTIEENYADHADQLPEKYLTIGAIEGGYLCINLSKTDYGSVYLYFADLKLRNIAISFSAFINGLTE